MGWRDDLVRVGITAAIAALMEKGKKNRARAALEVAFPGIAKVPLDKEDEKAASKGKAK